MDIELTNVLFMMLAALPMASSVDATEEAWHHARCKRLPLAKFGPFIELDDGRLMTFDGICSWVSENEGKTWSKTHVIFKRTAGKPYKLIRGALIKTHEGTIVLVYQDCTRWGWDNDKREPLEEARIDLCVVRSRDEGKTWTPPQKIFDHDSEPVADMETMDLIQTKSGRLVLPFQTALRHPGRWACRTYVSADDGKTWERSNLIDLRGAGNHGGAFEPTVAELSDGRVMMLIRTNMDRFWQAYSSEHGLSWRVVEPSQLDASSAPGYLTRLRSGRLMLAWNRLYPEGKSSFRRREPDTPVTQYPCTWHRGELSIAFSDDDGRTWTEPVVVLRHRRGLAYPYIIERSRGEIWVTTRYHIKVGVSLREDDFAAR